MKLGQVIIFLVIIDQPLHFVREEFIRFFIRNILDHIIAKQTPENDDRDQG